MHPADVGCGECLSGAEELGPLWKTASEVQTNLLSCQSSDGDMSGYSNGDEDILTWPQGRVGS